MKNVDQNTFLDIDLKSLADNYLKIKKKVNRNCTVAATVKFIDPPLAIAPKLPADVVQDGASDTVSKADELLTALPSLFSILKK